MNKKYNDNFLFIIILKRIILKQIFYYIYKRIKTKKIEIQISIH